MESRRAFLRLTALGAGLLAAPQQAAVALERFTGSPESLAGDEDFWLEVQSAFAVDRTYTNLNNGGVSPTPTAVLDAVKRGMDAANGAPALNLWRYEEPRVESVRKQLARMFGCDAEEIAITRNASESLQIVQLGLPLQRGDEVITTVYDYPRMITTWEQRARRDGIVVKKVNVPVPLLKKSDAVAAIEAAITSRTKVIHISQITFCGGQIYPVREITNLARSKGIDCIVDGAHAFAQFPFTNRDLECDFYGTSLHKWLYAPIGTGMLYVKKEQIKRVWPLMAAPSDMDENIRKFEEIGTHPAALHNAVAESLRFHAAIGAERKAARLRYLNKRWIDRIRHYPSVKFFVDIDNEANWCGLVLFSIKNVNEGKLCDYLLDKHRIIAVGINYADIKGVRITPNIYTTTDEIDRFADILESAAQGKIPEVTEG